MLSGLRYIRDSIFAKVTVIDISLSEAMEPEHQHPDRLNVEFYDEDDCCMNLLVESFSVNDQASYASFKLKDPGPVTLRYHRNHVLLENEGKNLKPDFVMAKCAAESILKILFMANIFRHEKVLFTARKNQWETDFKCISTMLVIQPTTMLEPDTENDTIAEVIGHLDIKEIRIYFNAITEEQLAHIENTLAQSFIRQGGLPLTSVVITT